MLLIGSRAAKIHFPEHRDAHDWDVVVTDEEYATLRSRFGPPLFEPTEHVSMFRYQGGQYEIKTTSRVPLWAAILNRAADPSEGELVRDIPVLGTCRIASPPLLLILKQCFVAYPIGQWRKSLLDYHFLRARIASVPPYMCDISRLGLEDAASRFGHLFEPEGNHTTTCSNPKRQLADPDRHQRLHDRFRQGAAPLVSTPDAWEGFPSRPVADRRALMVDLLVEEALVAAEEYRLDAERPVQNRPLCNWILRGLVTRYLPLGWRYFAADEYPEIQRRVLAALATG